MGTTIELRNQAMNLKRNIEIAERMMQKHLPAYERAISMGEDAMSKTMYCKYRRVFNRLNKALTAVLCELWDGANK
jgi:hypothetical protein